MKPVLIALLALCLCPPLAGADTKKQGGALIPPELAAAKKAYDEGRFKEAGRLWARELIKEQNKLKIRIKKVVIRIENLILERVEFG